MTNAGEATRRPVAEEILALAEIDGRLVELKETLQTGPAEIARNEKELQASREARAGMEQAIREKAAAVDQCNLDIKTYEADLTDQEEKIRICKNNKEYKILFEHIKNLKQQIGDKETEELQFMEELDTLRQQLKERQEALSRAEQELAETRARVARETEAVKVQQKELVEQRNKHIEKIRQLDQTAMKVYVTALQRGKGHAVAELADGICQACFRKASPNLRNLVMAKKDIVKCVCAGCGRILMPKES